MTLNEQPAPGSSNLLRNVLLAIAAVYIAFSAYAQYDLRQRVTDLEARQKDSDEKLSRRLAETQSRLEAASEALSSEIGSAEKQLAARAAELRRRQEAAESRLTQEQQATRAELGAVSGQISGVKSEVGGVKTEVASARSDLEATKAKLERAIGDLGVQSGLIARTRDDLETLRRKGDRDFFEFSITKSKHSTPVSTVSLRLKKADVKKGKFTLDVIADDRVIEKKDRAVMEPLQFYSGRERALYELVVLNVQKDRISGYLATPKK